MANIKISNQKPVEIYKAGFNLPKINLELEPDEYLNEVRNRIKEDIAEKFFSPLTGGQTKISIDKDNITPESLSDMFISCFTCQSGSSNEENLMNLIQKSFKNVQKNSYFVENILGVENLTKQGMPLPNLIAPMVKYTAGDDIIPSAKELITDPSKEDLWFGSLFGYLDRENKQIIVTFKTSSEFENYKVFVNNFLTVNSFMNKISGNNNSLLSDFSKISLDNKLQETIILNDASGIIDPQAVQNEPLSFMRILMHTISDYKLLNKENVYISPINMSEIYFPKRITLINLEEYAHASPNEIKSIWKETFENLKDSEKLKIVSNKKLATSEKISERKARKNIVKPIGKQKNTIITAYKQRKFQNKPVTSKDLIKMMIKVIDQNTSRYQSENVYRITKSSYMRPNRRNPNNINAMGKISSYKYRPDIHVYLDCSGSISESMYRDAVTNLMILAKKMNVNFYMTSFSHFITESNKIIVKDRSLKSIWKQFREIPKASGSTDFSLVWKKINELDAWNRKNKKSYQINFMITDFGYYPSKDLVLKPTDPCVKNLYYVPISKDAIYWDSIVEWAEGFSSRMAKAGDVEIKNRILM